MIFLKKKLVCPTGDKPVWAGAKHPSDRPYPKVPTKKQVALMKKLNISFDPNRTSRKLATILIGRKLQELKSKKY